MINPDAIRAHDFGVLEQAYGPRDAILYALGLGLGANPLDPAELRFLDERTPAVLPNFAVTLCSPEMWIREAKLGVDFGKLVHAAQSAEFPHSLPAAARVIGHARVISLTDRGEGRGAVLVLERRVTDAENGTLYCRLEQTLLLRGNGGFGGPPDQRMTDALPATEPDCRASFATSPRAALIYRLSGDWNPLHFDPDIAKKAGFSRPILHGLASYGMAGLAVSFALGQDPAAVTSLACRFSGIVLPGDKLDFSIWNDGTDSSRFSCQIGTRKVLDGGTISWRK